MNKDEATKSYRFVTKYLLLLALPMLLAVGSLYTFSMLIHRLATEQKVSALNHALAVAEQGIIEQMEQLMNVEVKIFRSEPATLTEIHKAAVRLIWSEKVHNSSMLDLIFLTDVNSITFSSDAERDAKQAEHDSKKPGRTPAESAIYKQALASPSPNF